MILDFQVGTSIKGHKILSQFAGRGDDDPSNGENKSKKENLKAPFKNMADAYLFALMLGLSRGEKKEVKKHKNIFHFNSVQKDYDIAMLLRLMGKPGDLESKETAKTAIEQYATWGLEHMDEHHRLGVDDYRLGTLLLKED